MAPDPGTPEASSPLNKECSACGAAFHCGAAEDTCWCARLEIGEVTAAELSARYEDCLCPGCLMTISRQPGED